MRGARVSGSSSGAVSISGEKRGEEEAKSDEGQWVLEWGYCTASAGSELGYLRGDASPPSPWPKPRDKQSWSIVLLENAE